MIASIDSNYLGTGSTITKVLDYIKRICNETIPNEEARLKEELEQHLADIVNQNNFKLSKVTTSNASKTYYFVADPESPCIVNSTTGHTTYIPMSPSMKSQFMCNSFLGSHLLIEQSDSYLIMNMNNNEVKTYQKKSNQLISIPFYDTYIRIQL